MSLLRGQLHSGTHTTTTIPPDIHAYSLLKLEKRILYLKKKQTEKLARSPLEIPNAWPSDWGLQIPLDDGFLENFLYNQTLGTTIREWRSPKWLPSVHEAGGTRLCVYCCPELKCTIVIVLASHYTPKGPGTWDASKAEIPDVWPYLVYPREL